MDAAKAHLDAARLIFGPLCGDRLQCMIGAYFDESGTQGKEHGAVTVGGYASTVDLWSRFCVEWSAALDEIGIPRFKSTDFKGARHDDERLIKLAAALCGNALYGVVATVDLSVYKAVFSHKAQSEKGSAYTFCTQAVIWDIYSWLSNSEWSGDSVQFVFDAGHRNQAQAAREMTKILSLPEIQRSRDSFTFGTDDSHIPLQAADLISYQANNHYKVRRDMSTKRRKWAGFALLQQSIRHVRLEFDREHLESVRDEMPPDYRKAGL